MSGDKIISLARARKTRARADKAAKGAENAVKFGRTKAEKRVEAAQSQKDIRTLDDHKREP